ncbi:MAG: hypothetical protein U0228_21010 [Myxococcaceae bacterium]
MKRAFTIATWRGTAFKLHVTFPLGLLLLSGFTFDPLTWVTVTALVLLHEVGHLLVVRAVGGRSSEVVLTGFGGWCRWSGEVSPLGRAAIACGGIAAQLLVLVPALVLLELGLMPRGPVLDEVVFALTFRNAWLAAFNLLPVPPLDGAEAWRFPIELGRALRRRLTSHRNVVHVGATDFLDTPAEGGDAERAKDIAAQLLANARKDEPE